MFKNSKNEERNSKKTQNCFHGIFIRAPKVKSFGDGVEVLAKYDGEPVLLRQKNIMVGSFHPELTEDARVHEYFLNLQF